MSLNLSFSKFKKNYIKKVNQTLFLRAKCKKKYVIENIIDQYLKQKNSFVFESVEKGKIRGRFTIVGFNPDKIWNFNNNNVELIHHNNRKKISTDPYKYLKKLIENFDFPIPKNLPPMSAILVGYFSYDIIRYIEKIPNTCRDDLKIPDIRILRPVNLIIHDNHLNKIYFIHNCFAKEKINSLELYYKKINRNLSEMKKTSLNSYRKEKIKYKRNKITNVKSNISKVKFKSMVKKAKQYIKNGDIFQVVLSQRFQAKLTKKPIEIYKKLRVTNPSPFLFFLNFQDFQIVGSSPEILVRLRNEKITIRPIAGTRPRGKNTMQDNKLKKDLLEDKKELAEHLMLLDLGRNDVGKVAKINTVKVTEKFKVEKYSHVMHIVSNVEGKFKKNISLADTLLSGFPAGTVSGAPKIRAMEIIDELEDSKRKMYAGGIGYFSSDKNFDTCIALRTALIKNNKFYIQSGAGIVADSVPEKEFEETVNKAKALLNSLN